MFRVVWATDVHLEFVDASRRHAFYGDLISATPDAVILSGDIGTAQNVCTFLAEIDAIATWPVLFVLGNHDYYHGSIGEVRGRVSRLARESRRLTYLSDAGIVELTPTVCVIGHDGWGDARLGEFGASRLFLNDFRLIRELVLPRPLLREKLHALGDEAAAHFARLLPEALTKYELIYIVTHVPPFREVCLNEGRPSDDDGLPFFACKVVGDVILDAATAHRGHRVTILCGHTHSAAEARVAPNVLAIAGGAAYGVPGVQRVLELPKEP
ncbi:MAG: metallophosphoesterase [Phycisphaerales bacterium]|nr:metallophosphoesterase [Phycisphaerales bacterium]